MYRLRPGAVKRGYASARRWGSSSGYTALLAFACLVVAGPQAQAQCPPLDATVHDGSAAVVAGRPGKTPACRFNATLTRLFTPHFVPGTPYRVYVTAAVIDTVVSQFATLSPAPSSPGAWTIQEMDPLEALGNAGPYDTAKVGRLYVGRRARVARGPLVQNGRTVATIMLMSPYPDPSLTRLEPGTMIIEFRIPNQ